MGYIQGCHDRFCQNGCVHYSERQTPGFVGDPLCDGGEIPNSAWWWMVEKGCGSHVRISDLMLLVEKE